MTIHVSMYLIGAFAVMAYLHRGLWYAVLVLAFHAAVLGIASLFVEVRL